MGAPPPLQLGETVWDWSRPYILAVVNVTPDSFSDGGLHGSLQAVIDHALGLLEEGADALDLGAESTRPRAEPVSVDEELARVMPVIEALRGVSVPISIDTMKAEVAREALRAGATIVNDVGMGDTAESLGAVAARAGAAYIAMHSRGTPATMTKLTDYRDVARDVATELGLRVEALVRAGVAPGRVLVDPGIGFAKSARQSLALLSNLAPLRALGYPLCVGASRKSFISAPDAYAPAWRVSPSSPRDRVGGTAAAVTAAVLQGAEVVRVHGVAVMREAARVAHAIRLGRGEHA
jgi:dihydropteroate synthase